MVAPPLSLCRGVTMRGGVMGLEIVTAPAWRGDWRTESTTAHPLRISQEMGYPREVVRDVHSTENRDHRQDDGA